MTFLICVWKKLLFKTQYCNGFMVRHNQEMVEKRNLGLWLENYVKPIVIFLFIVLI